MVNLYDAIARIYNSRVSLYDFRRNIYGSRANLDISGVKLFFFRREPQKLYGDHIRLLNETLCDCRVNLFDSRVLYVSKTQG
jgi:hypothetical protein